MYMLLKLTRWMPPANSKKNMEMSEQCKAGFYHHFISRSISMLNKESAAHQVDTLSRFQTNQYGNPSTSQLENWMFEVILVSKSCFRTLWPSSKKQFFWYNSIFMIWLQNRAIYQSTHRLTCITEDNVILKPCNRWYKLTVGDLLHWIRKHSSTWPVHVHILNKGTPLFYSLLIWLHYFSSAFTQL